MRGVVALEEMLLIRSACTFCRFLHLYSWKRRDLPSRERGNFRQKSGGEYQELRAATFVQETWHQRKQSWFGLDRGHRDELEALIFAIKSGGRPPVALDEYLYTTLATVAIEQALREGAPMDVGPESFLASVSEDKKTTN